MFANISILGKTIPAYSIAAAAGVIAAVCYTKQRVKHNYYADLDKYLELEIVCALTGTAIGAKLLYVLIEYKHILRDVSTYGISRTLHSYLVGGFVFYGGLIGCVAAVYIFCRSSKAPFSHSLQIVIPAIPLAHCLGRIGCFVTGCCFGIETHSFLYVVYSQSQYAPNGVHLVPVQLMESLYAAILFLVLHRDSGKHVPGHTMLGKYCIAYGTGRFLLEFLRGDGYRGYLGMLSVSQVLSLIIIIAGAACIRSAVKGSGQYR